jgi:hypothetical protein
MRFLSALLVAGAAATAVGLAGSAKAANWMTDANRQSELQQRIDRGVSDGSLSPKQARSLNDQLRALENYEARAWQSGISPRERADLNRRYDALSAMIAIRRDTPTASQWMADNNRMARLRSRVDAGARDGSLTVREANRLRADLNRVAALERTYRRNGVTASEQADLDRRFDAVSAQIRDQRADNQRRW